MSGEPGIGKSRLALEAAKAAHADGATVLYGRCDEGTSPAHQPWVEALGHLVAHVDRDVLAAHVAEHGGELARVLPGLGDRLPEAPPPRRGEATEERARLFEAIAGLLAAAAAAGPVLVVLDDLQWASETTHQLTRHVARDARPARLMLLATFRDADPRPDAALEQLLEQLARVPEVERLRLSGLEPAELLALVEDRAGGELEPSVRALVAAVGRQSAGSPYFAGEILRHLRETHELVPEGGRWVYRGDPGALAVPATVRDVIGGRVRRLPAPTLRALELGAVLGPSWSLRELAAMAGEGPEALLDRLEPAEDAALISAVGGRAGRFAFVHALVRDTLYEGLPATRRMPLHVRAVAALERGNDDDERVFALARHADAAGELLATPRAIEHLRRAGRRARERLAHEQAAEHFERALTLAREGGASPADTYELLIELGEAERAVSDPRFRATAVRAQEVARRLGDGERVARAALLTARPGAFSAAGEVAPDVIEALRVGLDALGEGHDALRARLLGQLAMELVFAGSWEQREELSDEALRLARRSGDLESLADVVTHRILALYDPSTSASRAQLADELLALAARLDSPRRAFLGHLYRAGVRLERANLHGALDDARRCAELAAELRLPLFSWYAGQLSAWRVIVRDPARADAAVVAIYQLSSREPDAEIALGAQRYQIRWDKGRLGDMLDVLRLFVEKMPLAPACRAGLALALCEEGRLAEAREQLAWFAERDYALPRDYVWWLGTAQVVETAVALGDRAAARRLLAHVAPWERRVAVLGYGVSIWGAAARYVAELERLLGREDDAERHFAAALALEERLGADTFAVRTRRGWASLLLERGRADDRPRAAALVERARADAERLGMRREVERLDALGAALVAP